MRRKPESEGPSASRHQRGASQLLEERTSSHTDGGTDKGTLRGLTRESILPSSMSAISCRMPSSASQNRSISALSSDSVGSIIKVPETGHDMVGAWKPGHVNSVKLFPEPIKRRRLQFQRHERLSRTVVLQPLGHVHSLNVCRLLEGPHVQNEFMSYITYKQRRRMLNQKQICLGGNI